MKHERTNRGFGLITFTDRYGKQCSLQESSLATEACIWLGIDDPDVKAVGGNAKSLLPALKEIAKLTCSPEAPCPEAVLIDSRMHLSLEQTVQLIPILQHFVETGSLPTEPTPEPVTS